MANSDSRLRGLISAHARTRPRSQQMMGSAGRLPVNLDSSDLLQNLRRHGFRRFILATHYLSEKFTDFVNAYRDSFPETTVVIEDRPLGTGGALRHAPGFARSPVFVALNGDSWVTQSFVPVLDVHARMGNAFTMVAAKTENVVGGSKGKGCLVIGPGGEIKGLVADGQEESW